jgi:hypothetical protein
MIISLSSVILRTTDVERGAISTTRSTPTQRTRFEKTNHPDSLARLNQTTCTKAIKNPALPPALRVTLPFHALHCDIFYHFECMQVKP